MRGSSGRWRNADDGRSKALFHPDSHWRDVLALTWRHPDGQRRGRHRRELKAHAGRAAPTGFRIDPRRTAPRQVTRAGTEAIEAIFRFETAQGRGSGVLRLTPDADDGDTLKAWTLLTALDELKGHEEQVGRARPHGQGLFARFPRAELARPAQGRRRTMPTAIRPCSWSAAARPGSRSRRGSRSCRSTR